MATQAEKLAKSLEVLAKLRDEDRSAIRSSDLTRTHRERLLAAGFLQEVMKGWYIHSRPNQRPGDSTAWYISFWGFCADYLSARFDADWCLSAEESLLLHAGKRSVPRQLLVRSSRGDNNVVSLPHETSLLIVRTKMPPRADLEMIDGMRVYTLATALIAASPEFFARNDIDLRAALARITDSSEILPALLDGGHSTIAGRLAGAFDNIGRRRIADDIVQAMRAAGYRVRKNDPFVGKPAQPVPVDSRPPYVHRLQMMWADMREGVISCFPEAPAGAIDSVSYLKSVEDTYTSDAYNSLSIEGYEVSEELVAKVRSGKWAPESDRDDREHVNALAARGYWQAFQAVRKSLKRVLKGENPGVVADGDHGSWYRELFAPGVAAGLIRPADLAGYRSASVVINRSRHVPPRSVAVRELLPTFFALLAAEDNPAARVVLGHFVFVFIHPYMDGNGRIGRFLMNVMMAAGGYPWLVIPVQRRTDYMTALEQASVEGDIKPFARLLAELMKVP